MSLSTPRLTVDLPGIIGNQLCDINAYIMQVEDTIVLELRPNCECCDKDLPPQATDAMICTFECTFCRSCAESKLGGICPNCGGNLAERPIRTEKYLQKYPPSGKRIFKPAGCSPD